MLTQQQQQAKQQAQHYNNSVDFFELFEADSFDEEVAVEGHYWLGLVRDESGVLQVYAEYIYDADSDSGTGWSL